MSTGFTPPPEIMRNTETVCISVVRMNEREELSPPVPVLSPRHVFFRSFKTIQTELENAPPSGVLLFCAHSRTLSTVSLFSELSPDQPVDIILGRHDQCQLQLPEDSTVSLRHLLIRLVRRDGLPTCRVLDLSTPLGFRLQDDQRVEGISAVGHCLFSVGAYHVFVIVKEQDPLPGYPDDAWNSLQPAEAPRLLATPFQGGDDPINNKQIRPRLRLEAAEPLRTDTFAGGSAVWRIRGPQVMSRSEDDPVSTLVYLLVQSPDPPLDLRIAIKASQLQRGFLIGRYKRCEIGNGNELKFSGAVSRVHLLIMEDEGEYWAIDTASTSGSTVNDEPIGSVRLEGVTRILLAQEAAITWMPVPVK